MPDRQLTESAWKTFSKGKEYKDASLLKALALLSKAESGSAQELLDALDQIDGAADGVLKSGKADKELAAYVGDISKSVAKARASAKQALKGEAKQQASSKAEDDEEEDDSPVVLTTKMIGLIRQIKNGQAMNAMVATNGNQTAVLISKKSIPQAKKKMLADYLKLSGGLRYFLGQCIFEENAVTFALPTQPAGLAKRVKLALMNQTGMRIRTRVRGENPGEVDEDLEEGVALDAINPDLAEGMAVAPGAAGATAGAAAATAGAAQTPQATKARTIKQQALGVAPKAWTDTRTLISQSIDRLREAIRSEYSSEAPHILADIEQGLARMNQITDRFDHQLAEAMDKAHQAQDDTSHRAELAKAKAILTEHIKYVQSEPMIAHVDSNPFGVETNLRKVLVTSLTQMGKVIA